MNSLVAELGLSDWKPLLAALMLPPAPFLVLALLGAWLAASRRWLGRALVLVAVAGVWLAACDGIADALERAALHPPAALTAADRLALRDRVRARQPVAIVVLGGGRESLAPEYGVSNLKPLSLARLRYGVWLARETGAPLAFSGGIGWAQQGSDGASEAAIAARIAQREYGLPLRWVEGDSRDTRENALRSVATLQRDGIREIVLVSHGWHLPRARRDFERAAGGAMRITAAPMELAPPIERGVLRWLPTPQGFMHLRQVGHELLGLAAGG